MWLRILLLLFYFVFFILMKCPSWTAANVAKIALMTIGIMDSMYNVKGIPMNSSKPVALLAKVWGKTHFLNITKAQIWLMGLMMTITPPQIHNHLGKFKTGIVFQQQQATKAKSAFFIWHACDFSFAHFLQFCNFYHEICNFYIEFRCFYIFDF